MGNTIKGTILCILRFFFYFCNRNIQFFGLESQRKVTQSFVVIIGLGGVGSHAASMLLRSGVGRLLLVDFDQVCLKLLLLIIQFCVLLLLFGDLITVVREKIKCMSISTLKLQPIHTSFRAVLTLLIPFNFLNFDYA